MPSTESHSVRNGVIATIVGGIALAILGELWPPVKAAIAWLWEKIQTLVGFFGEPHLVPGWALTILSVLALVTVIGVLVELRTKPTEANSSYIEDVLFGVKWRWSWNGADISNLWCFCPLCDGELVYDDSSTRNIYSRKEPETVFICEHCNRNVMGRVERGNKDYALGAVMREIRRKIRTGQHASNSNVG